MSFIPYVLNLGSENTYETQLLNVANSFDADLGAICLIDSTDWDANVAVAAEATPILGKTTVICAEKHESGDGAMKIRFIIPRARFDVFEYALNTSTAVKPFDRLKVSGSDGFTLAVSTLNEIAEVVPQVSDKNTTANSWDSVTKVRVHFIQSSTTAYFAGANANLPAGT